MSRATALKAAQPLGYSFRGTHAHTPRQTRSGQVAVAMDVANVGVAPFYYDWPVKFAYLDNSGRVVASASADKERERRRQRSNDTVLRHARFIRRASAGTYTLIAQGANPLTGGIPIRFANAQQDATKDGWLTLGTTSVTSGMAPGSFRDRDDRPPAGWTQPGGRFRWSDDARTCEVRAIVEPRMTRDVEAERSPRPGTRQPGPG